MARAGEHDNGINYMGNITVNFSSNILAIIGQPRRISVNHD